MRQIPRAILTTLLILSAMALLPQAATARSHAKPPAEKPVARPAVKPAAKSSAIPKGLPVTLIADRVEYDSRARTVTATGHVQVFYGERTLTADRITYDDATKRISAKGDIVLRDATGVTVYADLAELDTNLRDGLIRGAKAVMGVNVRLSAVEARRTGGRYNILSKAVYSPCKVCSRDPTPLWRIRARRVIHDEKKNIIRYEDAEFDVLGVPVAWLPYFSHPDPTAKRATGLLVPEIRQSSVYGWGIWLPYYWAIDPYSDATFDPFLTTGGGTLLGGEYRRAFASGMLTVAGTGTINAYTGSQKLHGDLEAHGLFDLPEGFKWGFDGIVSSDKGYLRRYDISDADRLTSELFLRRYARDGFFDLSAVYFQSLRNDEPSGSIPTVLPDFNFRHDVQQKVLGGDLGLFASTTTLTRNQGFDSSRFTIGADWNRQAVLPSGLVLRGFGSVRGDLFVTNDFSTVGHATSGRIWPQGGVEARYPLIYDQPDGTSHVLEPIAQAILAPYGGNPSDIPNEDSLVNEFDETNLFATSHFSGLDRVEEGPRLNLGLRYERISNDRLHLDASVGRVLRLRPAHEFSPGSGLNKTFSDWVGAWSVSYDPYVTFRQRMRVEDNLSITRNEITADLAVGRLSLTGSYTFVAADPSIDITDDREEIAGRAAVKLSSDWRLSGEMRRDLKLGRFVEIAGGLAYLNECCEIDLFVKRRFTSSVNAPAATSVGVQVKLLSLGTGNAP